MLTFRTLADGDFIIHFFVSSCNDYLALSAVAGEILAPVES